MELPERFKCLIAGTGDEEPELRLWCQVPAIRPKVYYLGCVEKDRLWGFYRSLDVLVLPSLTTSHWTEQFGFVLAEAMGCGVPVIGSNSGAIPEVVAECGIIVEENNPLELARAILCMADDADRRTHYVKSGLERFEHEFSVVAYAAKLAGLLGITVAG
jgi:glycosyltransferase involved in cell wall biosynthesis